MPTEHLSSAQQGSEGTLDTGHWAKMETRCNISQLSGGDLKTAIGCTNMQYQQGGSGFSAQGIFVEERSPFR